MRYIYISPQLFFGAYRKNIPPSKLLDLIYSNAQGQLKLIRDDSVPFVRCHGIPVRGVKVMLGSNSMRTLLAFTAICCDLHHNIPPNIHKYLVISGISEYKLDQAIRYAYRLGLPRTIKSRPDIGYKHRKKHKII